MERSWTDQPVEVEQAERVCSLYINERSVEVRKHDSTYYVTIGNLFGSETVKVIDAATVLTVLDQVERTPVGKSAGLPKGVERLVG